jgi:predicted aspartyl protease
VQPSRFNRSEFFVRGTGPASYEANAKECGPGSGTGTMTITSLDAAGSGTAVLSINDVGHFDIQLSANGQVMTMVEVADTGNYDVGTAVKR